jgi:hypothetical protein
MSRKSGYRFSAKDMRKRKNLERIPIQLKREALQFAGSGGNRHAAGQDPRLQDIDHGRMA